jgi:ribose transport system permease protein
LRTLRRVVSIREVGVLEALVVVVVLFSFLTPYFFKVPNLLLVTRQMAILAVIATGMTFVLAAGEVDVSVGWLFNLVMTVMALSSLKLGVDPWITILIGVGVGGLLGAVNGVVAVLLDQPTIIVTLGTLTVFRGIALILNGGRPVLLPHDSSFFRIGSGSLGPIPYMTLIMVVVVIGGAWALRNMRFARHLLAMGSNAQAAVRLGLQRNRLRILVMTLSGFLCGLSGAIGLAYLGAADSQSGNGFELSAISAAIIGGAQLGGGSGTVWGTLIGVALVTLIQNGLVLLGLPPAWQTASTGLVIIGAITVDYVTRTQRARAFQT